MREQLGQLVGRSFGLVEVEVLRTVEENIAEGHTVVAVVQHIVDTVEQRGSELELLVIGPVELVLVQGQSVARSNCTEMGLGYGELPEQKAHIEGQLGLELVNMLVDYTIQIVQKKALHRRLNCKQPELQLGLVLHKMVIHHK